MRYRATSITVHLALVILLIGCSRPKQDTAGNEENISDRIMNLHDDLMPKMDDIYRLKEQLRQTIEKAPDLPQEKRRELESKIVSLDSASGAMMVWMRQFDPAPDSLDSAALQGYFEQQLDKIEQVKEVMLRSMEEARGVLDK